MELIIRLYKENTEILCEQFDGRAFFNAIPVYLANKLGIEKYPDECFEASFEAFEKRLNLKASKSAIEKALTEVLHDLKYNDFSVSEERPFNESHKLVITIK